MLSFKILNFMTLAISIILSNMLLFFPEAIFLLFSVERTESADFICRRTAMFFIGYAVICYFSRNLQASEGRQAISLGIGISMLGLAILGMVEFFRGFAGAGIFLAVIAELFLSSGYIKVWWKDEKQSA